MAFSTSINGLMAVQQDMGVISNNIANVGTVGFKRSDTLFSEIYTAAVGPAGADGSSDGVLTRVRSDFGQGSFEFTSRPLDLAIDGQGLFVLKNEQETSYTRAGAFRLDSNRYIVTEGGANLQGFAADADGQISGALSDLQIGAALLEQKSTENINIGGNLDSRALTPGMTPFDPTNPESYSFSAATTIFDSTGTARQVSLFFVKNDIAPGQFTVSARVDDALQPESVLLEFTATGEIDPASDSELVLASYQQPEGAAQPVTIDLSNLTSFGVTSSVSSITQDGFPAGELTGFAFDRSGIAYASYSNNEVRAVGQVAVATFRNTQGLASNGKTTFTESATSGLAEIGKPDAGARGFIRPNALESANVDLTVELLALIEAQRSFQSIAQAIQNENEASDALLQLR